METPILPYGHHSIDQDDVDAVVKVLRSKLLTQGPVAQEFETRVAEYCQARYAVTVSSGTAALHLAALAAGFNVGDEVITTPLTFVATANCILYAGSTPVFADIDPRSYCLDPTVAEQCLSAKSKGLIPVHFAGHPCDMRALKKLASEKGLTLIEDAAHAIGSTYQVDGETFRVGSCAHSDMTVFSFHPVKTIAAGEGGIITTNSEELYRKLQLLRVHGITRDPAKLSRVDGPWYYEMQELGFNYRLSDIHSALGNSQLKKLDAFVARRREIAERYHRAFLEVDELIVPQERSGCRSSFHIYVLQLKTLDRLAFYNSLLEKRIGCNLHYHPVHLQPYYQQKFGFTRGDFPAAETYAERAITIPLFPAMTDDDVQYVIDSVKTSVTELLG